MIVVFLNTYLALLFILVKLKVVPFNLFWKISPVIIRKVLLRQIAITNYINPF